MNDKNEFRSSLGISPLTVRKILKNKIYEEKQKVLKNNSDGTKLFEKDLYKNLNYNKNKINVLSLFSGAGGLDLGAEMSGISAKYGAQRSYNDINNKEKFNNEANSIINIIYSNDFNKEANNTFLNNFTGKYIKDNRNVKNVMSFPKSNLMLGGFPCPGFSVAGPRLLDDSRNFLYIHYIRALMDSKPAFFVAENVKGIMTMANGKTLRQIIEDFSAAGYQVTANLVNAKNYGVPQSRERVFIIGIRNDIAKKYSFFYNLPKPTNDDNDNNLNNYITLKDAIGDLPIKPKDFIKSSYSTIYMSRNRKKSWNDQSFTIQASGRQAPQYPGGKPMSKIHKNLWKFNGGFNRRLSVRECARIQTFPDWFKFNNGTESKRNISNNGKLNNQYKQIGNAVPVFLAEKMIRPIIKFLVNHSEIK